MILGISRCIMHDVFIFEIDCLSSLLSSYLVIVSCLGEELTLQLGTSPFSPLRGWTGTQNDASPLEGRKLQLAKHGTTITIEF